MVGKMVQCVGKVQNIVALFDCFSRNPPYMHLLRGDLAVSVYDLELLVRNVIHKTTAYRI